MRLSAFSVAIAVAVLALTTSSAFAALTWKSGPTFESNGDGSFTATARRPVGESAVVATIVVSGTVRYTCVNKGGNESPGQESGPRQRSGSQYLGNSDHNGRGVFDLTVDFTPAATVSGEDGGLPERELAGDPPGAGGARERDPDPPTGEHGHLRTGDYLGVADRPTPGARLARGQPRSTPP